MQIDVVDKIYIKELDWTEWVLIHPQHGVVHVHSSNDENNIPFIYCITDNGVKFAFESKEHEECLLAVDKYEISKRPSNYFDEDYVPPTPDELDTSEIVEDFRIRNLRLDD